MIQRFAQSSLKFARTFPKAFHTLKSPSTNLPLRQISFPQYKGMYMFSMANHENISKSAFEGPGFYIEQLLTGCLSLYSYYIESNG